MSENKHYGRQIFLSLFLTVFILLSALYLASRYLLPMYEINQEQIYSILVKLFPILIGLTMIEIGVLVARRRDEDYADEVDKLPPNAYDRPLYVLPGDDPTHVHSETLVYTQASVKPLEAVSVQEIVEEKVAEEPKVQRVADVLPEKEVVLPTVKPVAPEAEAQPVVLEQSITYKTDFATILSLELDNSKEMDYDLTLVLVDVTEGPAEAIFNKMTMLSGELAYSFTLEGGKFSLILPFYNTDEARSFTLSIIDSCKKEFSGAALQIGFASRNGRLIEAQQLLHEAEAACSFTSDEAEPNL